MATVSFSSRSIRLSASLVDELSSDLDLKKHSAEILVDYESRPVTALGIKFHEDSSDQPDLYTISMIDGRRARISAKSVVTAISEDRAPGRYEHEWLPSEKMILVDLTSPKDDLST